jgi:hypothetical protein
MVYRAERRWESEFRAIEKRESKREIERKTGEILNG